MRFGFSVTLLVEAGRSLPLQIAELNLRLEATPEEHPRHVNVAGWPTEKDEQMALALEFCAIAILSVRLAEKDLM